MRCFRRIFLVGLLVTGSLHADHVNTDGNMDATMERGESKTFVVKLRAGSGSFSGNVTVSVRSSSGLELISTRATPALVCQSRGANLTSCSGSATVSGASELVIEQTIRVSPTAAASGQSWSVQFIGDGLSGTAVRSGAITVPAAPAISVMVPPHPAVATPGTQAEVQVILLNSGDAGGSVMARIEGNSVFRFAGFTDVVTIEVPPMRYATVSLGATATAVGTYEATLQLSGVIGETSFPLGLVVEEAPLAKPDPVPSVNRIDVASEAGASTASARMEFTNNGPGVVRGVFNSDSPWAEVPQGLFTMQPGETKAADIRLNLGQRPDQDIPLGSLTAAISLQYLLPASSAGLGVVMKNGGGTGSVSVSLVSTVKPTVTSNTTIPPKTTFGALFVTGVGRVIGSVGQFITDVSLFTRSDFANNSTRPLVDVTMYYTPLAGTPTHGAAIPAILPPSVARFGDLVSSVYAADQQIGTLQIRSPSFQRALLGVNTNIFNVSNRAGTYGTSIPVFSSQYGIAGFANRALYLVGLRKDSTGHTNFYFQETEGASVSASLEFYNANGTSLGTVPVTLNAYGAVQLTAASMPDGTVSAVARHTGGDGRFQAYATPVDRASGDTWAVADWLSLGTAAEGPILIPVAGAVPGANNTFFKTDVTIMNTAPLTSRASLRFYNRAGGFVDRSLDLAPMQTMVLEDATTTFFNITEPHVGHIILTSSQTDAFVVTARNYTSTPGSPGTYGTAVPPVSVSARSLRIGTGLSGQAKRVFGGVDDAAMATVSAGRPATFRSNLGFVETEGKPVRVKTTLFYRHAGNLASAVTGATASYDLGPNQFLLIGSIARAILGAERRDLLRDLTNIQIEVEIESGEGAVVPFLSSIDNGTGDSIFRVD